MVTFKSVAVRFDILKSGLIKSTVRFDSLQSGVIKSSQVSVGPVRFDKAYLSVNQFICRMVSLVYGGR